MWRHCIFIKNILSCLVTIFNVIWIDGLFKQRYVGRLEEMFIIVILKSHLFNMLIVGATLLGSHMQG